MTRICTLDAETFYDREFSLSKITTEHYVRDEQFETIGLSAAFDDADPIWLPKPHVDEFLRDTDWSDTMIVGQNTAFDGAILRWHYDVQPQAWLDIMGMSRALFPHEKSHSLKAQAERMGVGVKGDEVLNALGKRYGHFSAEELARYGEYCRNDVVLTRKLFKMYMDMGFPLKELKLIDMTLRMFIEPRLILDADLLTSHLADVKARKLRLLETVRDNMLRDMNPDEVQTIFTEGTDGIKKLLMSNDKFAQALLGLGVEPPTKVSPATGKTAWAFAKTDEAFKALEEHPNEDVQALVAARLGNKTTLEETRTERFIGMATRGAFPVPLRYYGAHSGRWSGQDSVNMQNLPSRGANAGKIKKAIKAPPGHVVIDCDSAQIEARVLAWLAGQEDLVKAFERKEDVYKLMASKIYGVPMDEVDKQQRQVGKTVVLGAGYGVGHVKLQGFLKTQAGVEVSLGEAKRIIDTYRSASYRIADFWKKANAALQYLISGQSYTVDAPGLIRVVPGQGLTLPSGLHIQYPDLRSVVNKEDGKPEFVYTSKGLPVRIYGGKVVENICQAVARQVVAEQMLRIQKRYPVVLTVHDAAAIVAPVAEAKEAQAYVEECMSWNPPWAAGLPLACEAGAGESYGDC
jgi:DNA polymerase I-like protein with 3'-5' exonuclease and polymerase domains